MDSALPDFMDSGNADWRFSGTRGYSTITPITGNGLPAPTSPEARIAPPRAPTRMPSRLPPVAFPPTYPPTSAPSTSAPTTVVDDILLFTATRGRAIRRVAQACQANCQAYVSSYVRRQERLS